MFSLLFNVTFIILTNITNIIGVTIPSVNIQKIILLRHTQSYKLFIFSKQFVRIVIVTTTNVKRGKEALLS